MKNNSNQKKKHFSFPVKEEQFKMSSFTHRGGIINRCVKVAQVDKGVALRDSKNDGEKRQTTLYFTSAEWKAFIKGVKNGEFD